MTYNFVLSLGCGVRMLVVEVVVMSLSYLYWLDCCCSHDGPGNAIETRFFGVIFVNEPNAYL